MNDAKAFRNALGNFPTGVTIVTTRTQAGKAVGVTINSFSSLSLDPPLILWSLATKACSYQAFATAKYFAVHILAADQKNLAERFALPSMEKFDSTNLAAGLGDVPLLPGCTAIFECSAQHCLPGGDHSILIGRVESHKVIAGSLPLIFHRGHYVVPEPGGLFLPTPALSPTG